MRNRQVARTFCFSGTSMSRTYRLITCLLLGFMYTGISQAGISLSSTRLVFKEGRKEESLIVRNDGGEIIVQSWLEPEAGTDIKDLPFVVTPPLVRVTPQQQQLLRVLYSGAAMATDKESIFWLNVQEIPQASDSDNALQFAFRQRIKVFYRPKGLTGDPIQATSKLQWRPSQNANRSELNISNPTPYYVSLVDLDIETRTTPKRIAEVQMLAPGESVTLPMAATQGRTEQVLRFGSMNEYGGRDHYVVKLTDRQMTHAKATE